MSTSDHLSDKPHEAPELFACSLYVPKKRSAMLMTCTGGFARKSRHSLITSPTKNAVQQVVRCRCAHNQAMIRNNDNLANQTIPDRRRRAMIGRRMETRSGSQWWTPYDQLQMWYFTRWKQNVQAPLSEVNRHVWIYGHWWDVWKQSEPECGQRCWQWWWRQASDEVDGHSAIDGDHIFLLSAIVKSSGNYFCIIWWSVMFFVVSLLAYPSIKFVKEWRQ